MPLKTLDSIDWLAKPSQQSPLPHTKSQGSNLTKSKELVTEGTVIDGSKLKSENIVTMKDVKADLVAAKDEADLIDANSHCRSQHLIEHSLANMSNQNNRVFRSSEVCQECIW